jgi:hypothetical protein
MKVANKKIPTEPKFIRMANGSSEPAAAPRTVKARVNRLLRQKTAAGGRHSRDPSHARVVPGNCAG